MLTADALTKALRRAFDLGQRYWQQADSEYTSEHRKADQTRAKFEALVAETIAAHGVPAVEGDARQQFETWMRRKHPQRSLERTNYPGDHGDGDYVDGRTHEKWHTWQEAYRHALWFAAGRSAPGVGGTDGR